MKYKLSAIFSIIIIGIILGTTSIGYAQQGDIIPTACDVATYTLDPGSTIHFYDDGGPGGDCGNGGTVGDGNFANANCSTITTICSAPGESLSFNFLSLSMFNTDSGFDWMVIYEGPTNAGNILFDNRTGGPDNPDGTSCEYVSSSLGFCNTSGCITIEFFASGVVNREGYDAIVTSIPSSSATNLLTIDDPTCTEGSKATVLNYDSNLTYTFNPTGPSINAAGEIINAVFGQNYTLGIGAGSCLTVDFLLDDKLGPTIDAGIDQEVCPGASVTLTADNPDGAIISWNNGVSDGTSFTPNSNGNTTYTVTAELNNCTTTDDVDVTINPIKPNIFADFPEGIVPHEVTFTDTTGIMFTNCTWDFGDGNTINSCDTVSHTYTEYGTYTTTFTVETPFGCIVSSITEVNVTSPERPIPNIFTPNGDNENDLFKLINVNNISELEVVVLNRWGNVVFESKEIDFKWNGLVKNNGEECSDGTYFYKINLKDAKGEEEIKHGFVQLMRDK